MLTFYRLLIEIKQKKFNLIKNYPKIDQSIKNTCKLTIAQYYENAKLVSAGLTP